ncbi:unnamed protein product [Orchesella dallaii]|uniref:Uncharacterized protein n=1 Tax=Orchesella dallaii TaxID=48710 RepID=A0ABP1QT04_9HEXA
MAGEHPNSTRSYSGSALEYVSTVLKSQFGSSEEFLEFERYFYYQNEEMMVVKNSCEQLQAMVSKLQEEKRSLELQLISEKASREQESKNASMEIEKNNVQQNAHLYSVKCEAESWKRKADAITTECTWLKDQMKTVEMEKNKAVQKLAETKSSLGEFERCRQSFDSYYRRQREAIQIANKKLDDLVRANETLSKIVESNQCQVNMMSLQLQNWNDERQRFGKKIAELENELIQAKAELVQNNAKLSRSEMAAKNTSELIDKLLEENADLHNGLTILTKSVGDQLHDADQQLLEKVNSFHNQVDSAVKRLFIP